jgi:hypothetical protein
MASINGNTFQSDIGSKEGKDGFIGLLFGHLGRMSFALNNTDLGSQSANIYYNSLLIINHIPDSELRKNLQSKLKARIEEFKREGKAENAAITTASIEIVGDVMDHIDEMLGIEKRAKISIELDCYSCKYKRAIEDADDKDEEKPEKVEEISEEIPENVPMKVED